MVYMEELPLLISDTFSKMTMNLSVEQAKHDRLSDRQAQLHFNQERFALELATTEVRNRIAREQSEIRHEEVDPESIGSGMS